MFILKRFCVDLIELEIKLFTNEDICKSAFIECIMDELQSSLSPFSEKEIDDLIKNAIAERRFNGYEYGLADIIISMNEIEENTNNWFCVV